MVDDEEQDRRRGGAHVRRNDRLGGAVDRPVPDGAQERVGGEHQYAEHRAVVRSASPREALMPVSNHRRVKDDVRFGSLADIGALIVSVGVNVC
jgi:hypothetical protein